MIQGGASLCVLTEGWSAQVRLRLGLRKTSGGGVAGGERTRARPGRERHAPRSRGHDSRATGLGRAERKPQLGEFLGRLVERNQGLRMGAGG